MICIKVENELDNYQVKMVLGNFSEISMLSGVKCFIRINDKTLSNVYFLKVLFKLVSMHKNL